jgi:transcriptional regulator with XRE-family HTH domain
MEINERFAKIRVVAGLNKKRFAESLGINESVSGYIELGKRDPSREVLLKLATVYRANINWLLTGEGEMFCINKKEEKHPLVFDVEKMIESKTQILEKRLSLIEDYLKNSKGFLPPES